MADPFGILTSHVGKVVRVHVYDGPATAVATSSVAMDHSTLSGTLVCLDDLGNIVLKDWACVSAPRAALVEESVGDGAQTRPGKRAREHTVAGRVLPTSGAMRLIRGSQITSIGLV